ncbi:MAG: phosphoglycerate kinase, partial [Proteobacteria bacterium]|nr:phosphoglycerate kinase [Pseudomonadota bacterium]
MQSPSPTTATPLPYPTLRQLIAQGKPLHGQRVLLRVDYNLTAADLESPLPDYRLTSTLPTIKLLIEHGARVAILSHRGRPQGRVSPQQSLAPVAEKLTKLLNHPVNFTPECIGRAAESAINQLQPRQVTLLENTRFHIGEQLNQREFTHQLAQLADVFVNDAFATAHRAHASTSGLAAIMPTSVIGLLMERELLWLRRLTENTARPLTLILSGRNVGTKLERLGPLLTKIDTLIVGGPVAHTFLAGRDMALGQSVIDHTYLETSRDLLAEAGVVGCRVHLPKDAVIAQKSSPETPYGTRDIYSIQNNEVVMDIGPETLQQWLGFIEKSGTVVWLGSLGAYEYPAYQAASKQLAQAMLDHPGFCLLGGNGLINLLNQT